MKTLLNPSRTLLLLAAAVGLSFAQPAAAAAAEKPASTLNKPVTALVSKVSDYTYLVAVSNPSRKASQVSLVSAANGQEVYRSSASAPSFGRKLNLENLADGQYNLVVKTTEATVRFVLTVQTQARQRTFQVTEGDAAGI